jgi:hypothetical protein
LVQIVEFGHVLLADLKVVDFCVFLDSAGGVALGERDLRDVCQSSGVWRRGKGDKRTYPSLLQAVADQDLTGRFLVLFRQRLEGWVIGFLVADEGAVGLDDDVVGLAELDSHALLVPGVQLESCQ